MNPELELLLPEIDDAIVLTEQEIAKREGNAPGSGYLLASFVKALHRMKDRIQDDSLSPKQRADFSNGLGRAMLDEWDFAYGPTGLKIANIMRRFQGLPAIENNTSLLEKVLSPFRKRN